VGTVVIPSAKKNRIPGFESPQVVSFLGKRFRFVVVVVNIDKICIVCVTNKEKRRNGQPKNVKKNLYNVPEQSLKNMCLHRYLEPILMNAFEIRRSESSHQFVNLV
jgi:hypothetical protein